MKESILCINLAKKRRVKEQLYFSSNFVNASKFILPNPSMVTFAEGTAFRIIVRMNFRKRLRNVFGVGFSWDYEIACITFWSVYSTLQYRTSMGCKLS